MSGERGPPWRTLLVGFGRVADTLGADRRMRAWFRHASHAQVLSAHPAFRWEAVIDPAPEALERARTKYGIQRLWSDVEAIDSNWRPDVAVIATPPNERLAVVRRLPPLRAVLVEKPLAQSGSEAVAFLEACSDIGAVSQVNYLRRADSHLQALAAGGLAEAIGTPQAVFAVYGGGLFNIASHMVDLVRMLVGEVRAVRSLGPMKPISGDKKDADVPFALYLENGVLVTAQVADPAFYREAGLDIWGTAGRLALMQEGLGIYRYHRTAHRGLDDAFEIDSGSAEISPPTLGEALYRMYDNLADVLAGEAEPWSDAISAFRTETVLHAVVRSAGDGGALIEAV